MRAKCSDKKEADAALLAESREILAHPTRSWVALISITEAA